MHIDIDQNEGNEDAIYQLTDEMFSLTFFVEKKRIPDITEALSALTIDQSVELGDWGPTQTRVWAEKDETGYLLSVGDRDSKMMSYRIDQDTIDALKNS